KGNGLKDYTVVDIEPSFLDLIKKYYPQVKTALVADSRIPFPDASFTAVIAASVLEHIPSLEETLTEVRRVLVPGGSFLVLVPRNGGFLVEMFKLFVTYPTLKAKGIRRPKNIWHYENANSFQRVRALLTKHFRIQDEAPIPFSRLPGWMSPLHFFL